MNEIEKLIGYLTSTDYIGKTAKREVLKTILKDPALSAEVLKTLENQG